MKHASILICCVLLFACGGQSVQTGPELDPIVLDKVKVFLVPPDDFVEIGAVETDVIAGADETSCYSEAVLSLRVLAAKLGANGVIVYPHQRKFKKWEVEKAITNVNDEQVFVTEDGITVYYNVKGKAIRVPGNKNAPSD